MSGDNTIDVGAVTEYVQGFCYDIIYQPMHPLQTGICARAIKPEIGFHVKSDVVSTVMPLKQVVLHIGSVLPQQLKQLFAGAIELPLVFFSIVQEYLQIIENRLFRNGNWVVFQPHRFIREITLVFVCVGQVNGRHMSTDFGKQFLVSQPYT